MPLPIRALVVTVAVTLLATPLAVAAEHHIGAGLHYWRSIDDLADEGFPEVEDEGVSWLLSYLYDIDGPLKLGLELEYFPDGFGGATDTAIAPQGLILLGGTLYGGVGAGVTASDSFDGNLSDPYFLARLGLDLDLLPRLSLDVHLNYQADAFDELGDVESDAVTLGATLRFRFRSSR